MLPEFVRAGLYLFRSHPTPLIPLLYSDAFIVDFFRSFFLIVNQASQPTESGETPSHDDEAAPKLLEGANTLPVPLTESEQRLHTIMEALPHIAWLHSSEWQVLYYNRRWFDFTGQSVEEARTVGWQPYLHPDDLPRIQAVSAPATRRGEAYEIEYRLRGADGEYRWFLGQVVPLHNAAGNIEQWLGTGTDITDRKEVEARLSNSLNLLNAVVEGTTDLVLVRDREGRYLMLNSAAARFHEISIEDALGKTDFDLMEWRGEDGRRVAAHIRERDQEVMRAGEVITYELTVDSGRDEDGGPRAYITTKAPLRDQSTGEVGGVIAIIREITERKRLEDEVRTALERQTRVAETLQRSLLLFPEPDAFPGVELSPFYAPASDDALVGGDFFDAFAVDETGRVALVVGDVTGKGLNAAAFTAEIKFALRTLLREHDGDPVTTFYRLNHHLVAGKRMDGRDNNVFACLALTVLDTRDGAVVGAMAGAEPPLLWRASTGGIEALEAPSLMLGIVPDWEGSATPAVQMQEGDTLLLFTDGITEARRGRQFLGVEGVTRIVAARSPQEPLDATVHAIIEAAREFTGGPARDDVCLLAARWKGDFREARPKRG
jgi:PAS domain S-box-containing protein